MVNYVYVDSEGKRKFEKIRQPKKLTKSFSIVIPTYNEEGNIVRLVNQIHNSLKNTEREQYEIVIVDDDSKDKTPDIIDNLVKNDNIIALHRIGAEGIFSAIRDGIKIANGKIIVMMDADFSHPPQIIPLLLKHIDGYDLVSGSRYMSGGGIEAPFLRKYGSILLNKVCRLILLLKSTDITGGFHAIRKSDFNKLKFKYYSTVFGEFDLELFLLASRLNFRIKEVPFVYNFRKEGASKVKGVFYYGFRYLIRAIQLRLFR